jgi:hypothetical protein
MVTVVTVPKNALDEPNTPQGGVQCDNVLVNQKKYFYYQCQLKMMVPGVGNEVNNCFMTIFQF